MIIITISIIIYIFIAIVVGVIINKRYIMESEIDREMMATLGGIFWPTSIMIYYGNKFGIYINNKFIDK